MSFELFFEHVAQGNLEQVKCMIEEKNIDLSECNAIAFASFNGYTKMVKYLALLPGADAGFNSNEAIQNASMFGHNKIVRFLATLESVDPSDNDNWTLRYAEINWNTELIQFLKEEQFVREGNVDHKLLGSLEGLPDIVAFEIYTHLRNSVCSVYRKKYEQTIMKMIKLVSS